MKKLTTLLGLIVLLVGCATSVARDGEPPATSLPGPGTAKPVDLPDLGPAPELRNDTWLNSDGKILRLADLRGRVVLLEFWTFG